MKRLLLWLLNLRTSNFNREYIYIRDLDGRYKVMYKQTYELLPVTIQQRMVGR